MNPAGGDNFGGGLGGGRGWRHRFYATGLTRWQQVAVGIPAFGPYPYGPPPGAGPTTQQEVQMLQGQAEYFQTALDDIRKRIGELESQSPDEAK